MGGVPHIWGCEAGVALATRLDYTSFVIKAYHQVGGEEWPEGDLAAAVDEVLEIGRIIPAIDRLDRHEMEAECFDDPERGSTIRQKWPKATPNALAALEELARAKVNELPRSDITQSLFNCADLLAGDLDLVFLRPGNWYSVPNGFVFDAQELLEKGARFRLKDLLGEYVHAIDVVVRHPYRSLRAARREILAMIDLVKSEMEYKGKAAYKIMEACQKGKGVCKGGWSTDQEIVWPGPLDLRMAIQVWKNGHRVG